MTEIEAIEWQKAFRKTYNGKSEDVDLAFDRAIAALEKQIPKKTSIFHGDIKDYSLCPKCQSVMHYKDNYCSICGQAIDWS